MHSIDPSFVAVLSADVAAIAVVATLLVIFFMRRGWSSTNDRLRAVEADCSAVRESKVDLELRFAVEEERASQIPSLERNLIEKTEQLNSLSHAKSAVEAQYAARAEGLVRVEAALQEVSARLKLAERSCEELRGQNDTIKGEKSRLEEALATRIEGASGMQAIIEDLRERLEAAQNTSALGVARAETLGREKGEIEIRVAEKSALLSEKSEASVKLRERLDQTEQALASAHREIGELGIRLATLQETLDQERKTGSEKVSLLLEAKEQMTQQFKVLAEDVMRLHGESFSKQNKEQIETVLLPLREKIGEFQQGIQTAQTESTKERATLAEQIRQLTESSARMTTETSSLTRALRGEAQTQGAWGEMILSSILERSGLRAGEEYDAQQSHANDDGQKIRPDVIVKLPGGQRIVIDSKLSLAAFDAHVNAETDIDRANAMTRHLTSMRMHIKTLSSKEYHEAVGSQIDYVIMFVPIEGALAVALQGDSNLTAFAVENSVAIATPTTLMIALRTVANVWQVERRNLNAEAIAVRAGRLYDKVVGFIEYMAVIGTRLNQARSSYDEAMGKLSSGSGNLLRQVEQLKILGAKTTKALPASLLGDGEQEPLQALESELPGSLSESLS